MTNDGWQFLKERVEGVGDVLGEKMVPDGVERAFIDITTAHPAGVLDKLAEAHLLKNYIGERALDSRTMTLSLVNIAVLPAVNSISFPDYRLTFEDETARPESGF